MKRPPPHIRKHKVTVLQTLKEVQHGGRTYRTVLVDVGDPPRQYVALRLYNKEGHFIKQFMVEPEVAHLLLGPLPQPEYPPPPPLTSSGWQLPGQHSLPGFENIPRAELYPETPGLGCNLYLQFCKDSGILNPPIPADCDSCMWQKSCEADMRHPDGAWEPIEYPEHFWWRLEHLPKDQRPTMVTPDSLDEFYKEPEPFGQVYRCNRCLSTDLNWQSEWIICKTCGWNEPLHDYPLVARENEREETLYEY